ncbi:MAG: HPP family protein [Burkholderiales bacterium]|nr:HPP family protein [Burkholderiales bacterium]
MNRFRDRLRACCPAALPMGQREFWLGSLGIGLGLWLTGWLSQQALGGMNPWFIAPMGASAVLLFLLPASPLAQPWSILGGNLVSALIGVSCAQLLGHGVAVAALAGALAAAAMLALRCLHPPGGAVALTAVLGSPSIHLLGYGFAFWPVGINSGFMLLVALLFNNLSGHRYPHRGGAGGRSRGTRDPAPSLRGSLKEDLDLALASFGERFDIDRDDLEEIVLRASLQAQNRRWGDMRCQDLMSRDVIRIGPQDSIDLAWSRLTRHHINALPVTDAQGRLLGMLSLHDFVVGQTTADPRRLPRLSTARRVEDIMSTRVVSASPRQPIPELARAFADGGLHHMPVLDEQQRVVGMVTPSDLLAVLFQAQP